MMAMTPMVTDQGSSSGIAETICSTADEIETATVRM